MIEITYIGMITEFARMRNEEEMVKNEIMTISGVNYKKLDAICERIKQYSTEHSSYFGNLNRIKELLLQGYSIADICYWLQGNKYESIDWRNNYMPTNYDGYADLLKGTIKVQIDNDRDIFRYTPKITDVKIIVPNKVVEVTFSDGTKEKSVCREPDVFSLESAISICISKKIMGGSSAYNNAVKRGIKVYEDKLKREELDKAEQKRIEKRRAKRQAYKERRVAKREEIEKEKQIEIQKEAYIRAMEYMNNSEYVQAR